MHAVKSSSLSIHCGKGQNIVFGVNLYVNPCKAIFLDLCSNAYVKNVHVEEQRISNDADLINFQFFLSIDQIDLNNTFFLTYLKVKRDLIALGNNAAPPYTVA